MKRQLTGVQIKYLGDIAEVCDCRPAADSLPGDTGWLKFNKLEMVTTFTYKPSLVKIDACNFELSW